MLTALRYAPLVRSTAYPAQDRTGHFWKQVIDDLVQDVHRNCGSKVSTFCAQTRESVTALGAQFYQN